jgi:hypothetical protein
MKIKRIYTEKSVAVKGNHRTSFDSDNHTLSYSKEMQGYIIDKYIFVPNHNIISVILEE